jgi:hypothetical protein
MVQEISEIEVKVTLQEIAKQYGRSPQANALFDLLKKKSVHSVFLQGLVCSSASVFFGSLQAKMKRTVLFVLNDADEAGYFYHDLTQMLESPVDILHAGLDVETAIDGKWANRQLQFVGKHEGTSAEHTHVTRKAAGTLREYHQRHALLQYLARPVIGSTNLGRSALVDKDMMCILASQTYQRNLADALLHHPLEVTSQEAVDQEDVESTLMIGNKHITLILL